MKRTMLLLTLLALPADAKPGTIWADFEVQRSWLVAEVEVLAITPGRQWGQWGQWQDYDIRVRVTSRPDRIFRGFALLGEEVQVTATAAGWRSCAQQLGEGRKRKRHPLLIVDDRRQVRMAGVHTGTAFRLQGFYDSNAIWIRCRDAAFGTLSARRTRIDVKPDRLGAIHRKERQAFWAKVARFVSAEKPALDAARIERLIVELASDDRARRERAHQALVMHGRLCVEQLAAAEQKLRDPEARRLLRNTLDALAVYRIAWQVSRRVPKKGYRFVLEDGMPALSGAALEHARAFYEKLTRRASKGAQTPR